MGVGQATKNAAKKAGTKAAEENDKKKKEVQDAAEQAANKAGKKAVEEAAKKAEKAAKKVVPGASSTNNTAALGGNRYIVTEASITTEMHLPKGTTGEQLMQSKEFTVSFGAGVAKALNVSRAAVTVESVSIAASSFLQKSVATWSSGGSPRKGAAASKTVGPPSSGRSSGSRTRVSLEFEVKGKDPASVAAIDKEDGVAKALGVDKSQVKIKSISTKPAPSLLEMEEIKLANKTTSNQTGAANKTTNQTPTTAKTAPAAATTTTTKTTTTVTTTAAVVLLSTKTSVTVKLKIVGKSAKQVAAVNPATLKIELALAQSAMAAEFKKDPLFHGAVPMVEWAPWKSGSSTAPGAFSPPTPILVPSSTLSFHVSPGRISDVSHVSS